MRTLVLVIGSLVLLAGGCATNSLGGGSKFDSSGLPKPKYYVGTATYIDYTAPKAGTLYFVEANTKTILLMESLDQSDYFEFDTIDLDDYLVTDLESMGIDPLNCKWAVYFIPAE